LQVFLLSYHFVVLLGVAIWAITFHLFWGYADQMTNYHVIPYMDKINFCLRPKNAAQQALPA
jgi:hypothetical protein